MKENLHLGVKNLLNKTSRRISVYTATWTDDFSLSQKIWKDHYIFKSNIGWQLYENNGKLFCCFRSGTDIGWQLYENNGRRIPDMASSYKNGSKNYKSYVRTESARVCATHCGYPVRFSISVSTTIRFLGDFFGIFWDFLGGIVLLWKSQKSQKKYPLKTRKKS